MFSKGWMFSFDIDFFQLKFFQFSIIKILDLDVDPDPVSMNMDSNHCLFRNTLEKATKVFTYLQHKILFFYLDNRYFLSGFYFLKKNSDNR
jgi:hypothetical protein